MPKRERESAAPGLRDGEWPDSWYAATSNARPEFPGLDGDLRCDACVIGGGYTGLSAALELAQAGARVTLLESRRVGFGASGRNGGQVGSGQRLDPGELERMFGPEDARRLWDLGEDAKALVRDLARRHSIDCDLKPGVASLAERRADIRDLAETAEFLATRYGYGEIETLDRDACQSLCGSPAYRGGYIDHGAGHLHPLNYALGLARAAAGAGADIREGARALRTEDRDTRPRVVTDAGTVVADHVILACNGYLGTLERRVARRVMPVNNFIAATEPLGAEAGRILSRDVAVVDSRFVVNYFRLTPDGRLLFGGGESYGSRFPADIAAKVRKPMSRVFPQLSTARIDHAWGGTLAITRTRLPHLARVAPRILSASGYSGHGVALATLCGKLAALAIRGQSDGFDTMARVPAPSFPGGVALRWPLLVAAMSWYALRDRLGV